MSAFSPLKRWIPHTVWVAVVLLLLIGTILYLNRDALLLYYHKARYESAELSALRPQAGGARLMEKLRRLLGLPRTDDLNTLAYHQQWLINAGYLVRRDLQLTNSSNVQVFTTNVMMEIGGPHSRVWFATNRALVVIAQPSHIEAFTRWILDHDAKMPTINHAGP